ncbi:hypothetical protein K458DRAFT_397990 [Lentithecium fluviatile CBS 122367]|uniref:Uncharacterized protein n=1 Tax=Lentithecium fluviatile CBS 122367 TaxID=1168545 RepID=A0A6G1JM12_9PLEO|nr:hypothetical protein K458DRAFT_397990 [Lentithecium fluviatile CBS 122367]
MGSPHTTSTRVAPGFGQIPISPHRLPPCPEEAAEFASEHPQCLVWRRPDWPARTLIAFGRCPPPPLDNSAVRHARALDDTTSPHVTQYRQIDSRCPLLGWSVAGSPHYFATSGLCSCCEGLAARVGEMQHGNDAVPPTHRQGPASSTAMHEQGASCFLRVMCTTAVQLPSPRPPSNAHRSLGRRIWASCALARASSHGQRLPRRQVRPPSAVPGMGASRSDPGRKRKYRAPRRKGTVPVSTAPASLARGHRTRRDAFSRASRDSQACHTYIATVRHGFIFRTKPMLLASCHAFPAIAFASSSAPAADHAAVPL